MNQLVHPQTAVPARAGLELRDERRDRTVTRPPAPPAPRPLGRWRAPGGVRAFRLVILEGGLRP